MRTFALKNADAQDVAQQLQDLNQDQSGSSARYIFNYVFFIRQKHQENDRGGRPPAQLGHRPGPARADGRIAKMITELDAPVSDDSLAPKIYPMKYASATDIEDVLNELFLKKHASLRIRII